MQKIARDAFIDTTVGRNEHLAALGSAAHALLDFTNDDLRTHLALPKTE